MLDISSHDVLLVGGGGAGLRAAIAVSEANPRLSVAVVSKVYPMRSHTVGREGGAAGVHLPDDSLDEHAYDTISGGDWLCDQDAVEVFVKEAPLFSRIRRRHRHRRRWPNQAWRRRRFLAGYRTRSGREESEENPDQSGRGQLHR